MSQKNYSERYQQKSSHLFDFGLYNVYDNNIINLSVGAPGPDLLGNCCEIFSEATTHRLVSLMLRKHFHENALNCTLF